MSLLITLDISISKQKIALFNADDHLLTLPPCESPILRDGLEGAMIPKRLGTSAQGNFTKLSLRLISAQKGGEEYP